MPKYNNEPVWQATLSNGNFRFAVCPYKPNSVSRLYWANSYEEAIKCYEEEYCAPNHYHKRPFYGSRSFGVSGFDFIPVTNFSSDDIWE